MNLVSNERENVFSSLNFNSLGSFYVNTKILSKFIVLSGKAQIIMNKYVWRFHMSLIIFSLVLKQLLGTRMSPFKGNVPEKLVVICEYFVEEH